MIGNSSKFSHFQVPYFDFPDCLHLPSCELKNERHFIEFLLRNDWVQRKVGIKMESSNGLFPDIQGEIYDNSGDRIMVEVEYEAENYIRHNHLYKGCDLVLSFIRKPETRFVKGVPVWSFYIGYQDDKILDLCLYDDINTNFDKLSEMEENYKFGDRVYTNCKNCGKDVYIKNRRYCTTCRVNVKSGRYPTNYFK